MSGTNDGEIKGKSFSVNAAAIGSISNDFAYSSRDIIVSKFRPCRVPSWNDDRWPCRRWRRNLHFDASAVSSSSSTNSPSPLRDRLFPHSSSSSSATGAPVIKNLSVLFGEHDSHLWAALYAHCSPLPNSLPGHG